MLIPVRCFNCGKLIGDKYDYYIQELRKRKGTNVLEPICFDGKKDIPETEESKLLKEMQITRYCCRIPFLTHVDLIEKV
jgi:DNA-directed RNA polymerase subunit N (RpoN/RPB10)